MFGIRRQQRLGSWYLALADALEAGLGLPEAVERTTGIDPGARNALAERLRAGEPVERVWQEPDSPVPRRDAVLLAAGAVTGRMPRVLRRLAAERTIAARQLGRLAMATAYPLFVLHFGALLVPVSQLIAGAAAGYVRSVLAVLVPVWLVFGGLAVGLRRSEQWRRRLLGCLPGFAGYQRHRDLAVLASSLEAGISAGLPLDRAWTLAGDATGAPAWRAVAQEARQMVLAGQPPSAALERAGPCAPEFVAAYRNGEFSGRLEQALETLAEHHIERADRGLTLATFLYPQLVFIAVAVWVAATVIARYAEYLGEVWRLLDGG
jgi:type II secretory pathway component PulF